MEIGPKSFSELRQYIRGDLRYVNGHPYRALLSRYLGEAGVKYCFWLRVTRYFYLKGKPFFLCFFLARLILKHYAYKYSFDISFRAQIDPGLTIAHYGYIVVMSTTKLGRNCTLRPGVVFGKKLTEEADGAQVGDNVQFGVGAKIIGPVKVGNSVIIGANSVVTKDIPSNSIVAGAPARILRRIEERE